MRTLERWKCINEIPNYKVSNLGRVKRITGGPGAVVGRILKPIYNGRYLNVALNGKIYKVHRLVIIAFRGLKEHKEVNHKDGNRCNNNLINLEWVTASENARHAFENGLSTPLKGEAHGSSKLKYGEVWLIKKLIGSRILFRKTIAKMFCVSTQCIDSIANGRTWKESI